MRLAMERAKSCPYPLPILCFCFPFFELQQALLLMSYWVMAAKKISKARFESLTFATLPFAWVIAEGVEWYSDQDENVFGILCRDRQDDDWGYVVLGRDEKSLFRGIETEVSISDIDSARRALHLRLSFYAVTGEKIFPQGDEHLRSKLELFRRVVCDEELNRNFVVLSDAIGYSSAKELIAEIAYSFVDPDGNYIQQFQTGGFDARLWELFLYALLHENDFLIDRSCSAPDYLCEKLDLQISIEAMTVNPTQGDEIRRVTPETEPDQVKLADYAAIKFGSALFSKLHRKYWELDHVKDHPLVFAIADFHAPQSMLWTHMALAQYLYAMRSQKMTRDGRIVVEEVPIKEHVYGNKIIPSGFFLQPYSENISAVLFSNSGTIAKFNRMGKLAGFGDQSIKMMRAGKRYDHRADAIEPADFSFEINEGVIETWSEGVSIFHNPRAKYPIREELFPLAAHHSIDNGRMVSHMPDFFPFASVTHIISSDS